MTDAMGYFIFGHLLEKEDVENLAGQISKLVFEGLKISPFCVHVIKVGDYKPLPFQSVRALEDQVPMQMFKKQEILTYRPSDDVVDAIGQPYVCCIAGQDESNYYGEINFYKHKLKSAVLFGLMDQQHIIWPFKELKHVQDFVSFFSQVQGYWDRTSEPRDPSFTYHNSLKELLDALDKKK